VDDRYVVQEPTLQGETIQSAGHKHLASWIPEIHGLRIAIFFLDNATSSIQLLAIEYVTLLFRDSWGAPSAETVCIATLRRA
jgi:hypothetical protein